MHEKSWAGRWARGRTGRSKRLEKCHTGGRSSRRLDFRLLPPVSHIPHGLIASFIDPQTLPREGGGARAQGRPTAAASARTITATYSSACSHLPQLPRVRSLTRERRAFDPQSCARAAGIRVSCCVVGHPGGHHGGGLGERPRWDQRRRRTTTLSRGLPNLQTLQRSRTCLVCCSRPAL